MYLFNPSKVVARRTLSGPGTRKVDVSFCLPQPIPDMPSDWYCAYRIENLQDRAVDQYALGIDSVQALQHALISAGEYLNQHPTPLSFHGIPHLGLPSVAGNLTTVLNATDHSHHL